MASKHSQLRAALTRATVDDELFRVLGDLRIEVVHQHSQSGLLLPALAAQMLGASRRSIDPLARRRSLLA